MSDVKRPLEQADPCVGCGRPVTVHCQGCGECHPVPDYEAAVDALERLLGWTAEIAADDPLMIDDHERAASALRRLRGEVPA